MNAIDDTRKGTERISEENEVTKGLALKAHAEWFVFDDLGIGYLFYRISSARTYAFDGITEEQKWTITNNLFILNSVFWGGTRYTRLGVLAGYGSSTYELTDVMTGSASNYNKSWSQTAPATIAGIYVDAGDDGMGARIGYNYLSTDYDPLEVSETTSYEISSSGGAFYFDFRWAI